MNCIAHGSPGPEQGARPQHRKLTNLFPQLFRHLRTAFFCDAVAIPIFAAHPLIVDQGVLFMSSIWKGEFDAEVCPNSNDQYTPAVLGDPIIGGI